MVGRASTSSAFPRSSRAIHADSLYPGLAILITLMVLLSGWLLWMVFFKIPFYETSQSAQVTPDALVVADFSSDVLGLIEPGQTALFLPGSDSGSLSSSLNALPATVVELDPASGKVWLLLPDDRASQRLLYPGLAGQVYVIVKKQSPLSLIIESTQMSTATS